MPPKNRSRTSVNVCLYVYGQRHAARDATEKMLLTNLSARTLLIAFVRVMYACMIIVPMRLCRYPVLNISTHTLHVDLSCTSMHISTNLRMSIHAGQDIWRKRYTGEVQLAPCVCTYVCGCASEYAYRRKAEVPTGMLHMKVSSHPCLCVWVCGCACIHIYMYIYTHEGTCPCMHIHMQNIEARRCKRARAASVCVHLCKCVFVNVYFVHVCICSCTWVCNGLATYPCMCHLTCEYVHLWLNRQQREFGSDVAHGSEPRGFW
jgi:hypothetical protein